MLCMILQFVAYAYAVAVLTLLIVFVGVAGYLKVSGQSARSDPTKRPRSRVRRSRFLFQRRDVLTPVAKYPPHIV